MAQDNGMLNLDYSINPSWLKGQFHELWVIQKADPQRRLDGYIGRDLRMHWLADLLVATGHSVDFKTGKIKYTRRPK